MVCYTFDRTQASRQKNLTKLFPLPKLSEKSECHQEPTASMTVTNGSAKTE